MPVAIEADGTYLWIGGPAAVLADAGGHGVQVNDRRGQGIVRMAPEHEPTPSAGPRSAA